MLALIRNVIDLRTVVWKETVWLNASRAACASIPFALWFGAMGMSYGVSAGLSALVTWPIVFVGGYLLWAPVFSILSLGFAMVWPVALFGRVMLLCFAVFFVLGDLILFVLWKFRPQLLPIDSFKPMNFTAVLYVRRPDAGSNIGDSRSQTRRKPSELSTERAAP